MSTEIPQKDTPVAEAVALKAVDGVQPEIKPGEKDCLGCDEIQAMIETALKDQAASAAAAAASAAEKTVKVDAAPRWLPRRSPPEIRHRRMMKT